MIMSNMMKAYVISKPADTINELQIVDVPIPVPAKNEVLIKIRHASLNPVDYKLIMHKPAFWQYPYIPGLDCCGEIIEMGTDSSKFSVGDMVAVHADLTHGGTLAEYVVQPEHVLFKIPDSFDLRLAAALPCAGLTAYQALVRKMNIQFGRTILIQAGSGGVGGFAILIAKAFGLEVISSCSNKNIDYVKKLGADIVIDYKNQDLYAEINQLYPAGVDYILETTTKNNLQKDIDILAFNGQISSIVGILDSSRITEFKTGFGFHEVALGGAYLSKHYQSQQDLACMGSELIDLLKSSSIFPDIHKYSFDEVSLAFNNLVDSVNCGKIVIDIP